jgi:CRISPR-associated protein Csb1
MTAQSAETTNAQPPSEETTKLFDAWLNDKGPVALRLRQRLLPVEADEDGQGVIFPPTYANIGYNIDTLADGTRVATIDTVGSQANRLEPIFKKAPAGQPDNPLARFVPQIEIVVYGREAAKKGRDKETDDNKDGDGASDTHVQKRSILDLAHRSADAVVLATPTLAGQVAKAFEDLRTKGNATSLCAIAPTSLVFGVWDSRGGSGEKRPRLVRAIIRAWDVDVLHSAAQFNSVWKALSEKQQKDLEKEGRAKKVELSEKGFKDAPATFRKTKIPPYDREGMPNAEARVLGGVLAKGPIERDVTINLVALRGLRGKDADETRQLQKYLLSLALFAATADLELFLREGCLLRYAGEDAWTVVPRRGEPSPASLPSTEELQKVAQAGLNYFGMRWPEALKKDGQPWLEHEFNMVEAKKLLAKKDDDASASDRA